MLVSNASNGILALFIVVLVSYSLLLVSSVALINFFIFLRRSESAAREQQAKLEKLGCDVFQGYL